MKIPVMGATGAIGRALIAALAQRGVRVVPPAGGGLQADFSDPPSRQWWVRQLADVDVVVNAAGIIRERGANRFEAVHTDGPIELFHGCAMAGVKHVVQLSALGADAQAATPFHCSKKVADDALRTLGLPATIVQPSLVHGPGIESAGLFDRLALLPWVALPEGGVSQVQPVALQDVINGLVALALGPPEGTRTLAFVGPQPLALRQHLLVLRRRLGVRTPQRALPVPAALALAGARVFERLPGSPFTADAVAMLLRGNTAPVEPFARLLGRMPRSLADPVAEGSTEARWRRQDALLGLWLTPLRWVVALLWVWTGLVSLGLYPAADSLALLASVGVTGTLAWWSLYGAAALDLALGLAVPCTRGRARRRVWAAQLATMAGYTLILSASAPQWWLHPFGPLSKNLPLAALIGLLWADRFWQPNTKDP